MHMCIKRDLQITQQQHINTHLNKNKIMTATKLQVGEKYYRHTTAKNTMKKALKKGIMVAGECCIEYSVDKPTATDKTIGICRVEVSKNHILILVGN